MGPGQARWAWYFHTPVLTTWLHVKSTLNSNSFPCSDNEAGVFWGVFLVALRPMSTAMVMAGQSVHYIVTTLFPGQA